MAEAGSGDMEQKPKCHDRRRFFAYFGRTPERSGFNREVFQEIKPPSKAQIQKSYKFHGAKMTKKNTTPSNQNTGSADVNLDSRYGAIGIPAVAAALQFQSGKIPTHAPAVAQQHEERFSEMAA
jgi:hypothetical protein